jgi:hypothetical protein
MNNFSLLENHFDLQKGMFFSEKDTFNSFKIFKSNVIEDFSVNYACVMNNHIPENLISEIETAFEKLNRTPCIYLAGEQLSEENIKLLQKQSYEEAMIDSWMVFNNDLSFEINYPVVRITNSKGFEDFKTVYVKAYGGEKTPEQPYGELPETYIQCLDNSFKNFENFYHFVIYDNGLPISIATLCYKDGIGGIYSVGTDPIYRGKGLGSAITRACIRQWKKLGGNLLLLQAETGSKAELLYSKLGFDKVFVGKGFAKSE